MLFALLSLPLAAIQEVPPAPPTPAEAPTPETVVVTVGDAEITYQELLAEINRLIPLINYHGNVPVEEQFEFREKALNNLIERALVFQDAERRGIQASEEEMRAELRKSIDLAGATDRIDEVAFEALLAELAPNIRRRILLDKNEARFLKTVPPVTEEQMRATYEDRKVHLVAPALVRVREILLKVQPGSTEEQALAVRDRLQRVLDELKAGGDFETLAVLHSEHATGPSGGDLGWVPSGRMRTPELTEALEKLADGETSGLVRTLYGYHILWRVETEASRPLSYEEVEEGLRRELEKRNEAQTRETWHEELRGRYPVEIRDVLPQAPKKPDATAGESSAG